MTSPNTDSATANPGVGGVSFAGWLINTVFWPLFRMSFGSGGTSVEIDAVPGQRLPVQGGGSVGTDTSTGKPALPNIGANFAVGGPYSSYVLLATVLANPNRAQIAIQNNSGGQIAVVIDDGTAAGGAAPVGASVFPLQGGQGIGSQGSTYKDNCEHGRLQVYGPVAGLQVMVREN